MQFENIEVGKIDVSKSEVGKFPCELEIAVQKL